MAELPTISIRELLEVGAHFGHKTMRWNPKMAPYLYGSRDGIHIIDLQQTVPLLHRALQTVYEVSRNNGRLLFVGTKRQASEVLAEEAKRCGQYFVNHRWLGGTLTNFATVSQSINTLSDIEQQLQSANDNHHSRLTKKEMLDLDRRREKLDRSLGGIRHMGGRPDLLFVIDSNKESLAIKEAQKLNIPVVAIIDSNSDPDGINYPIPGNDDATKAIRYYCRLIADAALAGLQDAMIASGVDIGAAEDMASIISEKEEDAAAAARPGAKKAPARKAAAKPAAASKAAKPAVTTVTKRKPAAKKADEASSTDAE